MFIHGLGGDAFKTWSNDKNYENSWPYWLGKELPDVGVWSIGYAASPISLPRMLGWIRHWWPEAGQAMALPDRALHLLDKLQRAGIGQRPLIFICHSLGGLVAKQILRTSRDTLGASPRSIRLAQVANNTRAVMFLATPHTGAALATKLDRFRNEFGTTVSMADLKAHDAHLRNLMNWYREHAPQVGIETITYYEGLDVANALLIVDETSSHPGVGATPIQLDKTHISIAKPLNEGEDVYEAARDLIRDCVPNRTTSRSPIYQTSPSTSAADVRGEGGAAVTVADGVRAVKTPRQTEVLDASVAQGQELLPSVLIENRHLRDENERLKISELEIIELKTTIVTLSKMLTKVGSP